MSADHLDSSNRPAVRGEVTHVEIDGERVVFDPITRAVFRLDRIGSLLFPFLDGTATIDELVADAADAFSADPQTVRADVVTLVEHLSDLQLLVTAHDPHDPPDDGPPPTDEHSTELLRDPPSP